MIYQIELDRYAWLQNRKKLDRLAKIGTTTTRRCKISICIYIWSFKKKRGGKEKEEKKKRNLKLRICGLNAWWWLNDRINHARAGPLFSLIWIFTSRTDPFRQPIRIFKGRPWLIHLNAGMQEIRRRDSLKICPGARQLSFRFKPANWGPRWRSGADEFSPKTKRMGETARVIRV